MIRRIQILLIFFVATNADAWGAAIHQGVLDLRQGFNGIIPLQGDWNFFPNTFVPPGKAGEKAEIIHVPGSWGARRPDLMPAHQGYASYQLRILLPDEMKSEHFGLLLPQISTAYRLFSNGQPVIEIGNIAQTAADFRPDYSRKIVYLSYANSILLTFHVANFGEALVGGLWKTPEFGRVQDMFAARNRKLAHDLFLLGAAFIFSVYHFTLYLLRRNDRSALAFALFCMIVAVRTATTGERVLEEYFSLPWNLQIKIEYGSIYLALPAFAWFVHNVYPREFHITGFRIILALCTPFMLHLIASEPISFGRYLRYMHVIILLGILWILYGIIQVVRKERLGAKSFALGTMALILSAVHDIISYNSFHGIYILPAGLMVFLFAQSSILAIRFADAFRKEQAALEHTREINRSITRFVPEHAIKLLGCNQVTEVAAGQQRAFNMTVLFADIRNFTTISEKMTGQETFNFLNAYLNRVGPVIRKYNGFIDKYMGDGIMALFPVSANDAIRATLELQDEVRRYNAIRQQISYPAIETGIGISYGHVAVGTLGESERMDVTVVSDTVNLAARLQDLSRRLGTPVLLSEKLFQQIDCLSPEDYRLIGQVKVKGKLERVTVFELVAARNPEQAEQIRLTKGIFERGIHSYWQQDYKRALELFEKCLLLNPEERVTSLYLQLCNAYLVNPNFLRADNADYALL